MDSPLFAMNFLISGLHFLAIEFLKCGLPKSCNEFPTAIKHPFLGTEFLTCELPDSGHVFPNKWTPLFKIGFLISGQHFLTTESHGNQFSTCQLILSVKEIPPFLAMHSYNACTPLCMPWQSVLQI